MRRRDLVWVGHVEGRWETRAPGNPRALAAILLSPRPRYYDITAPTFHFYAFVTNIRHVRSYTFEAVVGAGQKLSLQVDTGSSDLWIASKSCSSSSCGQTDGHLYDASSSTSTGKTFSITYLKGMVSGSIVWDKFSMGGYSLDSQALAAATVVTSEPLSAAFSGILGLALPLNSIIAELIPPVTSNSPDGAAWASNLFSITPAHRFLSLLLSRPGSDAVPAQLGIGRHPEFITQPSAVQYAVLESDVRGTLFWKVDVRAITVWVDGQERPVQLSSVVNGLGALPSAVLDSGVPLILTTSAIANGIYGAIGVAPDNKGQYYVPCTTPLNLTITLDDRPPIPLHPLDLTSESGSTFCTGVIQAADSVFTAPTVPADIILGVPFLRNTYTVMAYEPPDDAGTFGASGDSIKPRLGLLGITDPARAMDEFHTVRVLRQPVSTSNSSSLPLSSNTGATPQHLSIGLIVLISLLGFFALCLGLFGVRWCVTRRRFQRRPEAMSPPDIPTETEGGYAYARASSCDSTKRRSKNTIDPGKELYDDEETMRSGRWEAYMQDYGVVDLGLGRQDEVWGDNTLVGGAAPARGAHERRMSVGVPLLSQESPGRVDEFGARAGDRTSMAGVGTLAGGGKVEAVV
ncbi:Saccharopepsin [Termitomyces sp. J132]|nr:Saccharopepsin [Termitomyces sp. J132]